MSKDLEDFDDNCEIDGALDRLEAEISPTNSADGLIEACSVLGFSIDPLDRSGDPATDVARGFLNRLAGFLRRLTV